MFEIHFETVFAAAHQLRFADGSLEPIHGHNWNLKVTVVGEHLDEAGLVVDFHDVEKCTLDLTAQLHNRNANELPYFQEHSPSAERIALWFYVQLADVIDTEKAWVEAITLSEAPGCSVTYRPRRS